MKLVKKDLKKMAEGTVVEPNTIVVAARLGDNFITVSGKSCKSVIEDMVSTMKEMASQGLASKPEKTNVIAEKPKISDAQRLNEIDKGNELLDFTTGDINEVLGMEEEKELVTQTIPQCKFCNSDVWDNTKSKLNPKSPDYKCKKCGAGCWVTPGKDPYWKKNSFQKQGYKK